MKVPCPPVAWACCTAVLVVTVLAACTDDGWLGPSVPGGANEIGGPPITSVPPPPGGWVPKDVVPASQRQAQDTLVSYLRRTLQALPPGATLDADGYAAAGHDIGCDDDALDPKTAPVAFETIGNPTVPQGGSPAMEITKIDDIWRSWGWHVFERAVCTAGFVACSGVRLRPGPTDAEI